MNLQNIEGKTVKKTEVFNNKLSIIFTDNTKLIVESDMTEECYEQAMTSCCGVGTDTVLEIEIKEN